MPLTPFQIINPPRKYPKYGPFRRFLAIFSIALAISLIAIFIVLILPLIRGPVHPTDPAAPLPIAPGQETAVVEKDPIIIVNRLIILVPPDDFLHGAALIQEREIKRLESLIEQTDQEE